jgi:hypothetical protein
MMMSSDHSYQRGVDDMSLPNRNDCGMGNYIYQHGDDALIIPVGGRCFIAFRCYRSRRPFSQQMDWTGICQIGIGTGSAKRRRDGAA